jgi:hypothetical protein
MKVYEYCPFFNENKAAEIKMRENAHWVDELHICEANKTFSCEDKGFNFDLSLLTDKVKYHKLDMSHHFRKPKDNPSYYNPGTCQADRFDSWYWELLCNNSGFYNEAFQRNYCSFLLRDIVRDDDIVILSDLDEIIDSRFADKIIKEVKAHQVITVKLHYSVFYLNLFSDRNHGAGNYSYRIYIMTGKYFNSMPFSSDYLRKKGIAEALMEEVYCIEDLMGFHHSWLEVDKNGFPKLLAFRGNARDKEMVSENFLDKCLTEKKLLYLDANLYVDNEKRFLKSIKELNTEGLWYT